MRVTRIMSSRRPGKSAALIYPWRLIAAMLPEHQPWDYRRAELVVGRLVIRYRQRHRGETKVWRTWPAEWTRERTREMSDCQDCHGMHCKCTHLSDERTSCSPPRPSRPPAFRINFSLRLLFIHRARGFATASLKVMGLLSLV
jgi:hypothetical protein